MVHQVEKVDLKRLKGSCFYMAHLFLPDGRHVLTGGYMEILDYSRKHYDLCHGVIVAYRNGIRISKGSWCLFGRYTKDKPWFYLRHRMKAKGKRNGYDIYCWNKNDYALMRSYRKLPNQYLKDLKGFIAKEPINAVEK